MIEQIIKNYPENGKYIFPCSPEFKSPLVQMGTGFCNASNDKKKLCAWWHLFPSAMIGLVTGIKNNIVVLDVDVHSKDGNGFNTLKEFEEAGLNIPDTYRVNTPSGGCHYYFKYPFGYDIRNSVNKVGLGLDIRSTGGYVIAPGSITITGKKYSTVQKKIPFAEMPQWLIEKCLASDKKQEQDYEITLKTQEYVCENGVQIISVNFPEKYKYSVYFKAISNIENAVEGTRNITLFYNAINLYSFVAGGTFDEDFILEGIYPAVLKNGYIRSHSKTAVNATLSNSKKYGFLNPKKIIRRSYE